MIMPVDNVNCSRVNLGNLRVNLGNPRVNLGNPRVNLGDFQRKLSPIQRLNLHLFSSIFLYIQLLKPSFTFSGKVKVKT